MPTPTGLPQKNDRVEYVNPLTKKVDGRGTVLERGRGEYWSLRIQWDGVPTSTLDVDAAYRWSRGWLRLVK